MITTTVVRFLNTEGTVTLNGDFTVDTLRTRFASAFPYVANAEAEVSVDGSVKSITFKEKVADKGNSK